MSLNSFLLRKRQVELSIVEIDNLLLQGINTCDETHHALINQKEIHKCLIKQMETCIYQLCNHSFETDSIDISPERTITIVYCTICESTKQ